MIEDFAIYLPILCTLFGLALGSFIFAVLFVRAPKSKDSRDE